MSERSEAGPGTSETMTGRIDEYRELCDLLREQMGLLVLSADPWSGTTPLVRAALDAQDRLAVLVDARNTVDLLDLGLAIADAAVRQLEPAALGWWTGSSPPASAAGLQVGRAMSRAGIHPEALRRGATPWDGRLVEAVQLMLALTSGPVTLAIDHLGLLLDGVRAAEARRLLELLRTQSQRNDRLDLLLVEHPEGSVARALRDSGHPLYRAGRQLRLRRPTPQRFRHDLPLTLPRDPLSFQTVVEAATVTDGVPALTWQVFGIAVASREGDVQRAWGELCRMSTASTTRAWDLLRRVHPLAQSVVAAISCDVPPHAIAANSKSVSDALRRLRGVGLAWRPAPRTWRLADPLLARWVREHQPPWVERQLTQRS